MIDNKMPEAAVDKNYWANQVYRRMDYDCQIIELIENSLMNYNEKEILLGYYRQGFFRDEVMSYLHSDCFAKEDSLKSGERIKGINGFDKEALLLLNARKISDLGYRMYIYKNRFMQLISRLRNVAHKLSIKMEI